MLSAQEELSRIRIEVRHLRTHIAVVTRARLIQKNRADTLVEKVKEREQKIRDLEKENQKLKDEIEKIKKQRNTYKGMVFKPNQVKPEIVSEIFGEVRNPRGGQRGHLGHGRHLPPAVDKTY